jgi:hypothetical protein
MPIFSEHVAAEAFELLISAGNVATNASKPRMVLERIGLPQEH